MKVLISRMDMEKFESIWYMISEYNMNNNFYVLSETINIKDDVSSINSAQNIFMKKNPKYFHNY